MRDRHDDLPSTGTDDMGLRVEATPSGLRVAGELDLATAPVLAARLDPLPGTSGDVVVDLAALRFVDSTGLSVFVRAHQLARAAGRRLVLASPPPRVRRLLEITALDDVLLVDGDDAAHPDEGSTGVTA